MAGGFRDDARFYPVDHLIPKGQFPSVTTVLGIIDKSGPLMGWAVKEARKEFETGLLDVLTRPGAKDPEWVLEELTKILPTIRSANRARDKAAQIGTAAHAMIEWETRRMLGEDAGPRPVIPDTALVAVEAWREWARAVEFTPLVVEKKVYSARYGYAGTLDWIAKVKGVVTLGDYKTSKAVYAESFLQNIAYRAAAEEGGLSTEAGLVLRLPKTLDDLKEAQPFEAVHVPETATLDAFLAALRLWRWRRQADGRPVGTPPAYGRAWTHVG